MQNLRRGPVLFLSAGGGGRVKLLHGCPGGSVYPRKTAGGGGGGGKAKSRTTPITLSEERVLLSIWFFKGMLTFTPMF